MNKTANQVTTIKDKFGRALHDLRISVTDRCNFRCTYCMPAEIYGVKYHFLPKPELLTFEEIERVTRIFATLGLKKIRLTGGEPLLRNNVEDLVARLAKIEGIEDLTLTTNGYLLAQKAQALKDAGLKRITVSLDSMDDEVFAQMNGRGFSTRRVLEGIEKAVEVGLSPIKINAVVQKGVNDHTLVELAKYCKDKGYIVRFIEFMDVGNINGWKMENVVTAAEIVRTVDAQMPLEPLEANYRGEVANRYKYKDGSGEIGVIASVTQPFCQDCTRARLTTDGKIVTCLFASGGTDLRGPMRSGASDEEIRDIVTGVWRRRDDRYSEERASMTPDERVRTRKVEMFQIGG